MFRLIEQATVDHILVDSGSCSKNRTLLGRIDSELSVEETQTQRVAMAHNQSLINGIFSASLSLSLTIC